MTASTRPRSTGSLLAGAVLSCLLVPATLSAQDAPQPEPASGKSKPTSNPSLHATTKIRVVEGKTQIPVTSLLEAWGQATRRHVSHSPSVAKAQFQLSVGVHELSRTEILKILNRVDLTVVESEQGLFGLRIRDLATKVATEVPQQYSDDDPLPRLNQPITWTCEIKHGAGSAIYASLRGLLSRDPTRVGNILYIQGPEKLILTDLAPRIRYYRDLIRQLDTKSFQAQIVTIYRAPTEVWDALKTKPTVEFAKALQAHKSVVKIEEIRSTGTDLNLKQNTEFKGRVLLIKLSMITMTAARGVPFRITATVTEHSEKGDFEAEIDFVAPRSGQGGVTSVSFQGGEERLIVIVAPTLS